MRLEMYLSIPFFLASGFVWKDYRLTKQLIEYTRFDHMHARCHQSMSLQHQSCLLKCYKSQIKLKRFKRLAESTYDYATVELISLEPMHIIYFVSWVSILERSDNTSPNSCEVKLVYELSSAVQVKTGDASILYRANPVSCSAQIVQMLDSNLPCASSQGRGPACQPFIYLLSL
jgi:hypothetical protein